MATTNAGKAIEFARIGNPWLVGKNVSRVVPVYVVQNLLAPDLVPDKAIQAIKHLAFDARKALATGLGGRISVSEDDYSDLQETVYGLLSPERRIFRDKKNGGSGKHGSLFPMIGGLVASTGSDDGLGRRIRELMERHKTDWQDRLCELLVPVKPEDPATAFAMALLGGTAGNIEKVQLPLIRQPLEGIDLACATFVDNLVVASKDARRVPAIRRLATGAYFVSILRMVVGPVIEKTSELPLVLVYCGLPPGGANEPLVRAASKSFSNWTSESWASTWDVMYECLRKIKPLPGARGSEKIRQQIGQLLSNRLSNRPGEIEGVLNSLDELISGATLTREWCKDALESDVVGLSKSEMVRRVRSLGANIGLAGPDRGLKPRLTLDTPLLGVLVQGLVGREPMEFGSFVSLVAERFGLVLGIGSDDEIADRLTSLGSEGFDIYELLVLNQELLRIRLIRAGLARAYSDSHTEVYCNA